MMVTSWLANVEISTLLNGCTGQDANRLCRKLLVSLEYTRDELTEMP